MEFVRIYRWAMVFFWVASMGWLLTTRVLPELRTDTPPNYRELLPERTMEARPVSWSIWLNERRFGMASTSISRESNGLGHVSSSLLLEEIALADVFQPQATGLGSLILGRFMELASSPEAQRRMTLQVDSLMDFDAFGELRSFESRVRVRDLGECIRLVGFVIENKLRVSAYLVLEDREGGEMGASPIRELTIDLPPDRMVVDSLTPQPRFANLREGQRWTYQTYRPLWPGSPLQLIEAHVHSLETIQWQGESVLARRVELKRPSSEGLTIDRQVGTLWVLKDGTVVRQTLRWGSLQMRFERLRDEREEQSEGAT